MKTWTEMTDAERAAAATKGDAVLLMPSPADDTARRDLELALSACLSVPPDPTLAQLARLAALVLQAHAKCSVAPTAADADRLRRDIGDLRLALRDVPPECARSGSLPWLVRLHRAASEVAGIGVRETAETAADPYASDRPLRPGDTWRDPEGTEYVVVPAGDVSDRPRWLVGERTTPHHLSGLRTRFDLHRRLPLYHPYVLVERFTATAAPVPSPPLRIGDFWLDPEGTEYSVVAAADVGSRLCWWLSAGTTATEVGLVDRRCLVPGGLHSSLHSRFPLAVVLRETENPR